METLNATNKTTAYKPNMTVEKIALNKTVYLGNQTSFTIVVRNTGDCDLGNVTVVEKSYTGLVFDSYINGTGNWKRVGDKFVLDGVLAKNASASFRVIFNTTVSGNFTNVVVANSNVTENKTTENKTEVVPIRVNVTKVWNDNNNQHGMRPENVTIILFADGKKIDEIVLSDKNNWNHIFVELPMVKDGKVINYTVSEIPIENYTMNIINKTVDDFTVIIANNTYDFDVVNNESIDDSAQIFNESNAVSNESAQTELTKNNSVESKSISLSASKLSTTYASGKYFNVKAIDSKTKKPVPDVKLILKVYSGKKYKKISVTTDFRGIAKYYASNLGIGSHKVTINVKDSKKFSSKISYSSIKISRAKLTISAPKITGYYKESKRYNIAIKNRESKKPMKNIKVIIKVFTGKKYKKYFI